MQDLIWLAFLAACALAGVALTVLWIRARGRQARASRGDPESVRRGRRVPERRAERPPAPTPDLISVQQAWREREASLEPTPLFDGGIGRQDAATPTAPSGPRQGWQGSPGVTDEPTAVNARALVDDGTPSLNGAGSDN